MKIDHLEETPRDATLALLELRHSHALAERFSSNNGTILFVWAAIFLLDMLLCNGGLLLHSWQFGPVAMTIVNSATLAWRIWYIRTLPIRPRQALTNRVIFWWSWYYVALLLGGMVGWLMIFESYPPFWFTLLGVLGAAPLAIAGYQQYLRARI